MRAKRAKALRRQEKGNAPRERRPAVSGEWMAFARTFLIVAAATIIPLSLMLEDWFRPVNRLTALLVGELLGAFRDDVSIRGVLVMVGGFNVKIITECSAVHLVALLVAFMAAFPAVRVRKWIGILIGASLLMALNIIRIAGVTMVGRWAPGYFELAHIYLGQLGMLMATTLICLVWCRWVAEPGRQDGLLSFILRFAAFSCLPFLAWIPLNRYFVGLLDGIIHLIYRLAGMQLVIPRTHSLYYQSFSLVALIGLVLAVRGVPLKTRLRGLAVGAGILTGFQLLYRLCNVWISAFHLNWMVFPAQLVYNICVYAIPLATAFLMMAYASDRSNNVAAAE